LIAEATKDVTDAVGRLKPYLDKDDEVLANATVVVDDANVIRNRCFASKFEVTFVQAWRSSMGPKAAGKRFRRLNDLNTEWSNGGGNAALLQPALWAAHQQVIAQACQESPREHLILASLSVHWAPLGRALWEYTFRNLSV
jgi:hypothetical protein